MYIPYNKRPTSKASAKRIRPMVPGQKKTIFDLVLSVGRQGLTAEQISDETGISGDSVRPRLLCLEREGRIRRSGRTRKTKAHREAEIWEACGISQSN